VSNDCHVDSVVDIVLAVGSQVAAALAFLHKNRVLHGDLKPANVLMEGRRGYDEGDESTASESECAPERILSTARMVLSDFGLSSSTATRRRASRQEEAATRARKRESGGVLGSARKRTKGKAQTSLDAGALVNGKRVMGTHMYLAPELTLVEAELLVAVDSAGEHSAFAVAAAADVFALGIFLAAIARKVR
jgi:serine/threonine protein kinase